MHSVVYCKKTKSFPAVGSWWLNGETAGKELSRDQNTMLCSVDWNIKNYRLLARRLVTSVQIGLWISIAKIYNLINLGNNFFSTFEKWETKIIFFWEILCGIFLLVLFLAMHNLNMWFYIKAMWLDSALYDKALMSEDYTLKYFFLQKQIRSWDILFFLWFLILLWNGFVVKF